jgi:hypothetical protein
MIVRDVSSNGMEENIAPTLAVDEFGLQAIAKEL